MTSCYLSQTQQQSGEEFQNLSTVSTLLSGVTATTIQYNSNLQGHNVYLANVFWIVSLIFSTGSAIQSQLAFYWLRHPRHQYSLVTPTWAAEIIRRSPVLLFVVSVISFSGGLILYTYAAFTHTALPSIAVACTALTLSMFFLSAQWRIIDGILWIKAQGVSGSRVSNLLGLSEFDSSTSDETVHPPVKHFLPDLHLHLPRRLPPDEHHDVEKAPRMFKCCPVIMRPS